MSSPATPSLLSRIQERIRAQGPLPFAEYMNLALYEPEHGYYVQGPARMGWEGDYYTSTDLSPLFAHCVGRQLSQFWHTLGKPEPFVVWEEGAGRGHLAQAVQQWANEEKSDFAQALNYRVIDIQAGQDVRSQGDETEGPHVILANELIDAFPVHIVQKYEQELYEVYVDLDEQGRLREILTEPSTPALEEYLLRHKIDWRKLGSHWRGEINLTAESWLSSTAQLLGRVGSHPRATRKRGFLLLIDYGEQARDLYLQRPRGTLACYYQHQISFHPLSHPGKQDITAHVNFSSLIACGRSAGLRLHTYTTQGEWLKQLGITEEMEHVRQRDFSILQTDPASDNGQKARLQWYNFAQRIQALIDPAGMGNFKVLIMQR